MQRAHNHHFAVIMHVYILLLLLPGIALTAPQHEKNSTTGFSRHHAHSSSGAGAHKRPSRLHIVYNCFINFGRSNWSALIAGQIQDLVDSELTKRATGIHVAMSGDYAEPHNRTVAGAFEKVISMIKQQIPKATVEITLENRFEYPGIRAVWDIAHRIPTAHANHSYILYFHTKGMFNHYPKTLINGVRTPFENHLFETVIKPWKKAVAVMDNRLDINKVGYAVAPGGYMWFNFWWARASYVKQLVQPVISPQNRFYYEGWICMLDTEKLWSTGVRVEIVSRNPSVGYGVPSGPSDCAAMCLPDNITYSVVYPQPKIDEMCNFNQHPGQRRLQPTTAGI